MNSDSLCSLADRYDNPFPIRFLAPIDCLKIPALSANAAFIYTRTVVFVFRHCTKALRISIQQDLANDKLCYKTIDQACSVSAIFSTRIYVFFWEKKSSLQIKQHFDVYFLIPLNILFIFIFYVT
jgi:hypothetical protein